MARRSDHTREELKAMAVAAATRIVTHEGVQALSARRVAKDIGYTVGTLYLVFQNLDELILHVNAATLTDLENRLTASSHHSDGPRESIMATAQAYWNFAQKNYARWSLLFSHQLPAGTAIPDWFHAKVSALFKILEKPLSQLAPTIPKATLVAMTRALWGGVHGVCELALSDKLRWGAQVAHDKVIRVLVENCLNGFLNKSGEQHA